MDKRTCLREHTCSARPASTQAGVQLRAMARHGQDILPIRLLEYGI